jgi:ABC-type uncharacterized transport system ATPase subunit
MFGADPIADGSITLEGTPIRPGSPADARDLGIGLVRRTASSRRSSHAADPAELLGRLA